MFKNDVLSLKSI